jgi:hypothetical protein
MVCETQNRDCICITNYNAVLMWNFFIDGNRRILPFLLYIIFVYILGNLNLHLACRILSDCIPIKGRKRIPYLVIASLLSLLPWPILGLNSTLRSSQWHLTIVLTVQNLGSALADVVVDAMIAEGYVFVYI